MHFGKKNEVEEGVCEAKGVRATVRSESEE